MMEKERARLLSGQLHYQNVGVWILKDARGEPEEDCPALGLET